MPRSRGLEAPQRQSPRGVLQLRTSSSDSDQSHQRAIPDRSPKTVNRCSPRSVQSDSPKQKKLGTRIADLESQLGQAQDELKNLKDQLRSAKAVEKETQEEMEKETKKPTDSSSKNQQETEFFEVQVENVALAAEKPFLEEIALLKSELHAKEEALELLGKENEDLKNQLEEAGFNLSLAKSKGEEMTSTAKKLGEELEASKENAFQLQETVTSLEGAKQALEAEMKRLRVQTEQWRKAADAAAAVLAGGVDTNMDKHFGGYNGFVGSPGMAKDSDDGFGSEKRKGSRTRMFGDLWRKKSQK